MRRAMACARSVVRSNNEGKISRRRTWPMRIGLMIKKKMVIYNDDM